MLHQEVYALDGTEKAQHPYTVTEQNFTIRRLQPCAGNRHGVFFTRPREAISYSYERNLADPRINHTLTLEVNDFGNVLRSITISYGRRQSNTNLAIGDQNKQTDTLITYTENDFTISIDDPDDYRTPLPSATRTYELGGFKPTGNSMRFGFDEWEKDGIRSSK